MVNFIFSLGLIDKRLIIPFLNSVVYIIDNVYFYYYPDDDVNIFFYFLGFSVGEILVVTLPYIFKYKKKDKKEKKCTKENIIDYFLFLFLNLIGIIINIVIGFYDDNTIDIICTTEAIEIIFICLATAIFFKYKYYIHHIICIIIFLILSIIIDIMLDNFKKHDLSTIIFKILFAILEAIGYIYLKYMLDIKYHYFWNVSFICGVFDLIAYGLIFIILYIIKKVNNDDVLLESLELYKEGKGGYIVIRFLFGIIIGGFFTTILECQTLNIFNPNYIFVCYEISKLPQILLMADTINDWLSIIPFSLQIIILLFYLEIFEFNFCNLNKNTKRCIQSREREETSNLEEIKGTNLIELMHGYYIKDKETKDEDEHEEISLEMEPIKLKP